MSVPIELQAPQIELHRWGLESLELADECVDVRWSWSVEAPWHTVSLTLATPRRRWWDRLPKPGDWIVIRHGHDGLAEAFAYVTNRSWSVDAQPTGHVKSGTVKVSAIGFFDLLGRAQTYVAPGLSSKLRRGTIMSLNQWLDTVWNDFVRTASSKSSVGSVFASVARKLGRIRIPDAIADEMLGRSIRYAYNKNTRNRYCSTRPVEPVRGPSLVGLHAGLTTQATVLNLLMGTFLPDRNLVEIFPTLERVENPKHMSRTGRVLGTQPVVVYRMRPFAASSLARYARAARARNKRSRTPSSSAMFRQAPWDVSGAVRIPANAITNVSGMRTDDDHVNAVTVGMPMQQDAVTRFWDKIGLPLYATREIERRGVRLFQPNWPFFPPGDGSLISHSRAVAGRAWQFQAGADRFESGEVSCAYIRALRHGALIDVEVPAEIKGAEPGSLVAYARRVTHSWTAMPNAAWSSRSTVEYIRGLFDEAGREFDFPEAAFVEGEDVAESKANTTSTASIGRAVVGALSPGTLTLGGGGS